MHTNPGVNTWAREKIGEQVATQTETLPGTLEKLSPMMCSDATTIVVAALLLEQGRLLICQRSAEGAFPNKWEFPGGKIEPGEDPQEALRRELREELEIVAEVGEEVWRTEHQYPGHPPVRLLFFAVRSYSGAVENRVFQEVRWAALPELAGYDFLEADRPLVARLASGEMALVACEKSQKEERSTAWAEPAG